MSNCILLKNSYITIQPFMVTTLNLSGNSLIIYAAIYGITVNKGSFHGSVKYLAAWCNSTEKSVIECLKKLTETGLIKKTKTPRGNIYVADTEKIYTNIDENSSQEKKLYEKSSNDLEESSAEGVNKSVLMGNKSSHNILDNTLVNNLDTYSSAWACDIAPIDTTELKGIGQKQFEVHSMLMTYNKSAKQGRKIPVSTQLLTFVQKELRDFFAENKTTGYDELITALKNYLSVASSDSWKSYFTWRDFTKNYVTYTPEYFDEASFKPKQSVTTSVQPKTPSADFSKLIADEKAKAAEKERVEALRAKYDDFTSVRQQTAEKIYGMYKEFPVYAELDFKQFRLDFAEVSDYFDDMSSLTLHDRIHAYLLKCQEINQVPKDFKTVITNGLINLTGEEE